MKITIPVPKSAEAVLRKIEPALSERAMKAIYREFLENLLEQEDYYPPSQFEFWLDEDDAEHIIAKYIWIRIYKFTNGKFDGIDWNNYVYGSNNVKYYLIREDKTFYSYKNIIPI